MSKSANITIESVGSRGDGIGHLEDGRKVFVPYALPGESVSVEIAGQRDDGLTSNLIDVAVPSPDRIAPACKHFGTCGGCVLQHMSDDAYRSFKIDALQKTLGSLSSVDIDGPHVSPPGSRRRAVMAAYRDQNMLVLGFNQSRSNKIVDIEECPVLVPRLTAIVPALRETLFKILTSGQGMDVAMMESAGAVDIVLRPWVRKKSKDPIPLFILEHLTKFAEKANIARLSWQNSADDDTDLTPVAWRAPFTIDLSGTSVTPPPGAFLQATAEGEAKLVSSVLSAIKGKKQKIVDLYAGCGTFTFALSGVGHKVHAVEGFALALSALKIAMPGRPVTAEKRDLAREPLSPKELSAYDVIVLDPPRVGAFEQAKMIARSNVKQVIYVSCSSASFARDAKVMVDAGYVLESLTVVDQFLWSPHLELVGVFIKA